MRPAPTTEELDRFRMTILDRLGLHFADERTADLTSLLRARAEASADGRIDAYLARLQAGSGSRDEIRALARELTVGETFFLRSPAQFDALAGAVVPTLARAAATRTIRILSAGCATGEEAYSIGIVARERFPDLAPLVRIQAIDANVRALEKAVVGRYSSWSLRDTPSEIRTRYFSASGPDVVLDESVRRMVVFEERNLAQDDPLFWAADAFDVVFCRNVIMYFSQSAAKALVSRFARSLVPGGHLFLGHAESLRGLSDEFELCHTHHTFYYRRASTFHARPLPLAPTVRAPDETPRGELEPAHAPTSAVPIDAWMAEIQRAAAHIDLLARAPAEPSAADSNSSSPAPTDGNGLSEVVELLRREHFSDALARLRALPAASSAEPHAQLLLAVALTNAGEVGEAERACRRLLALQPRNPGGHYLMALCGERAGDVGAAGRHDRIAATCDPSFSMPHLHLGLLAKRSGDREAARVELARALELLAFEDESRIVLFGGGFRRDALVELCRASLRAVGASDG